MTQLSLLSLSPPTPHQRAYYARSHQTVLEAEAGERKALGQEAEILAYFQARPGQRIRPSEVWRAFGERWPLTSVRARITTMQRRGLLIHHQHDRAPGAYGAAESAWSLA